MLFKIILLFTCFVTTSALSAQTSHEGDKDQTRIDIFGRFLLDHAITETDETRIKDTMLRNARIGIAGKYGHTLKFKVEVNRSDGNSKVNLTDGYVEWRPSLKFGSIRLGQFKTPNSLDEETSLRFASAQERAAFTDAFELDRRAGIAYIQKSDNHFLSFGAFANNLDADRREEGYALAARGAYNPVRTDAMTVHLGASIRYREQNENLPSIRYAQRPFSRALNDAIGTDYVAQSDVLLAFETAVILDSFWAAGEYATLTADCLLCNGNVNFQGYYIEAGYVFGGMRSYKGGRFDRFEVHTPVTKGGMGALAVMARYDTLDLVDAAIDGGQQNTYVVGVDWWLDTHIKLSINYFDSENTLGQHYDELDDVFARLVASSVDQARTNGLQIRTQFDF